MDKKTTPVTIDITSDTVVLSERGDSESSRVMPSKSTIAFLRQFARAYSYEPSLGASLGGFVAN